MHNAPTGCKTILLAVDPLKGEVAEWHQRVGAGMRCSFGSLPTQTILRFWDSLIFTRTLSRAMNRSPLGKEKRLWELQDFFLYGKFILGAVLYTSGDSDRPLMELSEVPGCTDFMPIYTFQGFSTFWNLARGSLLQLILAELDMWGQILS